MITNLISKAKNNNLIKNSVIFFVGSLVGSVGSYFYQLFMGRMLSLSDYGELQSLLSVLLIVSVPTTALTLVITQYSARYQNSSDINKVQALLNVLNKKFFYLGIIIFLFLIILSRSLANYLQIKESLKIIIINSVFVVIFLSTINKGVLQGWQQFRTLSLLNFIESFGKLLIGLCLVYFGWQVYGAISGVVIATFIGYYYSIYYLKKFFGKNKTTEIIDAAELKKLVKYSLPVFLSLFSVVLLVSLDVIMAKHYLSPELAGSYGGLAILGRIIFFATGPIISVLFSVTAQQHHNGENYRQSFIHSTLIVFAIGLGAVVAYFLFPQLIIQLLLGSKYLNMAPYLGWYALAIALLSLINLLINFLLSIKVTNCVYWPLFGTVLLFVGILIWHQNIIQFIWLLNGVMLLVMLSLLFVIWHNNLLNFKKK